ncbi:peptidylprolyl isomerase [Sarracenia purpurea var. burkii]
MKSSLEEEVVGVRGCRKPFDSAKLEALERRIQRLRGHSPDSAVPYSTKEVASEKKLSEDVGMLEGNEKGSEIKVVAVEAEAGEGETETDSKYDESKESEDESCEDEACDEPEGEHSKTTRGNESDLCYEHKVFEVMPQTKISPLTETSPSVESSGSDSLKTVSNLESSEKLTGDKVRGIHNAYHVVDVRPKTNLSLSKADGGAEFHSQHEGRGGVEGIASASGNSGVDQGHVPPVQRSVLEILPLLHPAEHLSSMWSTFLGEFLQYLPSDSTHQSAEDNPEQTITVHNIHDGFGEKGSQHWVMKVQSPQMLLTDDKKVIKKTLKKGEGYERSNEGTLVKCESLSTPSPMKLIGKLQDGNVFLKKGHDNEEDLFEFKTDEDQVIEGLDRAVMKMKKGEVALLIISAEYAFGPSGSQQELDVVPPNSTVYYEVELVSFVKAFSIYTWVPFVSVIPIYLS